MRWFVNVLIWLVMTIEVDGSIFEGHWSTPFTPISTLFFRPVAHIVPWDALVMIAWAMTRGQSGRRVPAVGRSVVICGLALLGSWLWGVVNGGSTYQVIFQLRAFVIGLFFASTVASVYRTRADILSLGRTLAGAIVYRSFTAIGFWYFVAQHMETPPIAMTEHTDTVIFVVGLFLFVVNALERRTASAVAFALLAAVPIMGAIAVNNRRLAWLAVGVAFVLMYILLPKGKLRSRINRILLILSPFVAAYVAAGWGNPTGIFKPVGSISTMFGEHQDTSSLMRDIENYNLQKSLKWNPLLGMGFGREYIEELVAIDISNIFPQYRYLPHNSFLGFIAFTGMIGFAGIWQMVVVACYLHALTYRGTAQQVPRIAAMCSLIAVLVIELQMWGDLGFSSISVCTMLAIVVGLSARLPTITGVWPPRPVPSDAAVAPPAGAHVT
jgi:hypothetical protein